MPVHFPKLVQRCNYDVEHAKQKCFVHSSETCDCNIIWKWNEVMQIVIEFLHLHGFGTTRVFETCESYDQLMFA